MFEQENADNQDPNLEELQQRLVEEENPLSHLTDDHIGDLIAEREEYLRNFNRRVNIPTAAVMVAAVAIPLGTAVALSMPILPFMAAGVAGVGLSAVVNRRLLSATEVSLGSLQREAIRRQDEDAERIEINRDDDSISLSQDSRENSSIEPARSVVSEASVEDRVLEENPSQTDEIKENSDSDIEFEGVPNSDIGTRDGASAVRVSGDKNNYKGRIV